MLLMKNIACHISKQRMLQPSSHHVTAIPMLSPEGPQDRNIMPIIIRHCSQPHPPQPHWPQIAEVHIKGMISVSPDSCIFPYTEKH